MQINNIYNVGIGEYNAYVVKGEKCALIDGVPAEYSERLTEKLTDKIDYIVFNHASPWSAGALERVLEIYPDAVVIGTISALKNIKEFMFAEFNERVAKDCEVLDLGGVTLEFHITPNVPWPDTMITYAREDRALFSGEMFSSKNNSVKEFYDNELRQMGGFVRKCIEKTKALDIEKIYPLYGNEINDVSEVCDLYETKISENLRGEYVVLCYASRYGYTREMAEVIAKTLENSGMKVKLFDAEKGGTEMKKALNYARAVGFGAPTINRNAPEKLWEAVCGLDAAAQRGIPCMTFGSYGWSGDAPVLIHKHLRAMNFKMFEKPFTSMFRMNNDDRESLIKYSERFAGFVNCE